MGYFQRLVIGVVIIISASTLLEEPYNRNYFHRSAATLLDILDWKMCYCSAETIRIAIVGFFITSGIALAFDICISMAVITEIMVITKDALQLRNCTCLGIIQNVLIHTLLLLYLLNEYRGNDNNSKVRKNSVSSTSAQPAPEPERKSSIDAPKKAAKANSDPKSSAAGPKQKKK